MTPIDFLNPRIGDSLRTHPDMLLEDPDFIDSISPETNRRVRYSWRDKSLSFVILNGYFIVLSGSNHPFLSEILSPDVASWRDSKEAYNFLLEQSAVVDPLLTAEKFAKLQAWYQDKLSKSSLPDIGTMHYNIRTIADVAGRIWGLNGQEAFVSIWGTQVSAIKHADSLARMFQPLGVPLQNVYFEFVDHQGVLQKLNGREDDSEPLSPKEIKKLQAKQHVDPAARAKLNPNKLGAGSIIQGQRARAVSPAEWNFKRRQESAANS